MSTPMRADATAVPLLRLPAALADATCALRALAKMVGAWREAGKRAAEDRDVLARMSDRDLLDIGIARSSVTAATDRTWIANYPW